MTTQREGIFIEGLWTDDAAPVVDGKKREQQEVGSTSAPLASLAFAIGQHCQEYNEDFMLCKNGNQDPAACLLEGRRVTRCALDLIAKVQSACNPVYVAHHTCLDGNNQLYQKCRSQEQILNACLFAKLGLVKKIPGVEQIHEKESPIYK